MKIESTLDSLVSRSIFSKIWPTWNLVRTRTKKFNVDLYGITNRKIEPVIMSITLSLKQSVMDPETKSYYADL